MNENDDRELKVLLVEDDPTDCTAFSTYVDLVEDVYLIGITNNTARALEYAQDSLPDAIILDLELHLGGGSGLTFLKDLHELNLAVFPYVLITTNNTSQITYDLARQLGADYIMSKHQEGYSAESVIEFLRSIKSGLHGKLRQAGIANELLTNESVEELSRRIRKRINAELDLIGISPKLVGREYLIDAIQITINQPEHYVCNIIAQRHRKSESTVERSMQHAINSTWNKADIDILKKHYTAAIHHKKGTPTITEFIYYYARKIKDG
ncbi:MAG: response regulator [Clostridiales Family XIII bacterium]|jgi:DNA-binding NarL/FixJ family response regulator|nr:response regulator [Clostridiales Family XIII bacterium]